MSKAEQGTDAGAAALAEGIALVEAAAVADLPVRLMGGLAIRYLCPDFSPRVVDRQDLDVASLSGSRSALTTLLEARGYVPDRTFNALYGHKQLYFQAPSGRALDVLIDGVEMCHALSFKDRIDRLPMTLDVCDLLLTKLQIVELNEKDARDIVHLLAAFAIDEADAPGSIGLRRFRDVMGSDWGWWRTTTLNLDRIQALVESDPDLVPAAASLDVPPQLDVLRQAASDAPKSLRWRLRARVGERVRWYETPEESTHH